MANNYVRPALNVYQQVDDTVVTPGDHLSTCLIGASYELHRYGYEELPAYSYSGASLQIPNPALTTSTTPGISYSLDTDSVSLYGTNLEAIVVGTPLANSTFGYSGGPTATMSADPFVYSFSAAIASADGTLASPVHYPVEVGDIVHYNYSGFESERTAKVVEVIYDEDGKSRSIRVDSILATATASGFSDNSAPVAITKPVTAELPFTLGAQYVNVTSSTVKLPAYDKYSAYSASLLAKPHGQVYLSYRLQEIHEDEGVLELEDTTSIQQTLGTIAPENDLAYAAYCALKGANGRTVYAVRTRGTDRAAFTEACEKTDSDSSYYNFCAVTDDVTCMDAVTTFNAAQSTPARKHWRITFVGPKAVSEYQVADSKTITAMVTYNSGKTYVQLPDSNPAIPGFKEIPLNGVTTELHTGDKVEINGTKYVIDSVSDKTLVIYNGLTSASGAGNATIKLFKADTAANAAEYAAAVASSFADRRVTVVWSDHAMGIDGTLDNKYIAATVAGMSSAYEPQAPLTRAEVPTVASAARMYTRYTQAVLDDVASKGVMIVTQETKGGPCFIRHQLTTETEKGVLYSELSITRNFDNISYAIADALETHVGRSNVTPAALDAVYASVLTILTDYTGNSTDAKIGPSLGKFDELQVYQDPTFLTRVIVKAKLYLPVPMNNIDVYLMAYAYDTVTGTFEITAATAA